jgi:hypothetical protein
VCQYGSWQVRGNPAKRLRDGGRVLGVLLCYARGNEPSDQILHQLLARGAIRRPPPRVHANHLEQFRIT